MDTMTRNHLPFAPEQDETLDALDSAEDLSPQTPETSADEAPEPEPPKEPPVAQDGAEPESANPPETDRTPQPDPVRREPSPSYVVSPEKLDEAAAKIGEIDAARDALAQRYEEGQIDFREYDRESRKLADSRATLQAEQIKADVYADMSRQQQASAWNQAVKTFYADEANAAFAQPSLQSMLAAELKSMWEKPDVAGKDYLAVLEEAKASVQHQLRSALGIEQKQQAAPPGKTPKPAIETASIPKTLGAIPTARPNATDGEFSHLDALDEMQLERQMNKMTRDQIERYLAA